MGGGLPDLFLSSTPRTSKGHEPSEAPGARSPRRASLGRLCWAAAFVSFTRRQPRVRPVLPFRRGGAWGRRLRLRDFGRQRTRTAEPSSLSGGGGRASFCQGCRSHRSGHGVLKDMQAIRVGTRRTLRDSLKRGLNRRLAESRGLPLSSAGLEKFVQGLALCRESTEGSPGSGQALASNPLM